MLLDKITEEEVQFIEAWNTPRCLLECLFSEFDNLARYEEDKFSELRLYQYPLLSWESIIDFDGIAKEKFKHLTKDKADKEKFKLRKNIADIFCFGARKFGKCEWEENICTLANGQQVSFKELIGKKKKVISLNQETLKLEYSDASFFDNGIQSCYSLITDSAKKITVTSNHPFLTARGWIPVSQLTTDDFIATPRNIKIKQPKTNKIQLAKILGYLLGDGGCSQSTIGFSNINQELIDEVCELADYYDCSLRKRGIDYFFRNKVKKLYKKNKVTQLVKEYNIDKLSKEKQMPKEVFSWNKKLIKILLNRLYACDGHVDTSNYSIELTLASQKLIEQVRTLLLRFEIHSYIYEKTIKADDKIFKAWRLFISADFDKFLAEIGIKSKDHCIRRNKKYSTSDRLPNSLIKVCYPYLKNKKKYRLRNLTTYNPSRLKCQQLAEKVEYLPFSKIANSDIRWEKVKKINYEGQLPTVAVSVPKNNNYISNDIISHNTLVVEKLDLVLHLIYADDTDSVFSSIDLIHIRRVLDKVKPAFQGHPIIKAWKQRVAGAPNYTIETKNGNTVQSVNFALSTKDEGDQWYGHHVPRLYLEEASLETEEVYKKRKDALSELGAVFRISGMTNFTRLSPAGKAFYNPENKKTVVNLPQFVNPTFDEEEKRDRIKEYGGTDATSYKVFVDGKVMEDGVSEFDMKRIEDSCFKRKLKLKRTEITKEKFSRFKDLIVVERPSNADRIFIASDIGESSGSEIIIASEIGDKYKYLYAIVLYNLTHKEQAEVFKWLASELSANIIAFDAGDGTGRAIYRELEKCKNISKENLVWYDGSKKLTVGFDIDENGKILIKNGKPIVREEYMSEWSVRRLKVLLYEGRFIIPEDFKFESQFSSVISIKSGTRTIYKCISETGDHLFDAFKVLAIAQWQKKDFNLTKPIPAEWGIGVSN